MSNESHIEGNANVVIQGVTDSTITISVDGKTEEIIRKLDALQLLLERQQVQTIRSADKIYDIGTITEANFDFVLGQLMHNKVLPTELAQNLIRDENKWVESLRQEILKQGVSVGNKPWAIFQHYGWLIEAFLQKMGTTAGQERTLRRLSFMAEVFQGSLRYLCYVQFAQLLKAEKPPQSPVFTAFVQMKDREENRFDYLNLLILATDKIHQDKAFMPELNAFVTELTKGGGSLYGAALFLERHRDRLMEAEIEEDSVLEGLLEEYLTALVFWLRKLSFLAKYRLVSIKDINLNYRLGTPKNFVHLYGELHGMYAEVYTEGEDYSAYSIVGEFT